MGEMMDNCNSANSGCVSTLTFHNAINYGGVLQAYALQRAIEETGYSTEVLNYVCPAIHDRYHKPPKGIKGKTAWLLKSKVRKARQEKFNKFCSLNMKMSEIVDVNSIGDYVSKYSCVIVGSDQVWNPGITGNDTTYFLDFLPANKKKSYAASIGSCTWDDQLEPLLSRLLKDFSFLTVREETASKYLSSFLGYKPRVVSDPVFLLSKEKWDQIEVSPNTESRYLLYYTFGAPNDNTLSWCREQASKLGLQLAVIHYGVRRVLDAINIRDAGPEEFLGWIKNACLVVSPSFHACCFSMIYERDFCWYVDSAETQIVNRSSRIMDLLSLFHLDSRVVCADSELPLSINYEVVSKSVREYRDYSMSVLSEMLEYV